jgi:D-aspartate ligase
VILGGMTNALSVARGLGERGIEVHAVGPAYSPTRGSRHCSRFAVIAVGDVQAAMLDWLRRAAPSGAVLIPCDDDALELIALGRAALLDLGHHPAEGIDEVILDLLDKERTYDIARAWGVGAPRTVTLRSGSEIQDALNVIGVPCALKPLHIHQFARHFRRKVILIRSAVDLQTAFKRTQALGLEMLLTEIIPGDEDQYWSYYTYVADNDDLLLDFTKRKIRQYPVGFGGATYHASAWNPEVAEVGRRFVRGAGIRGVACIEFKLDPRDGQYKIMECNSRVTAANELMRAAGMDLGWVIYQDAAGLPVPRYRGFKQGVRLWYPVQDVLAFAGMRRAGTLSSRAWLGSLIHRQHLPIFTVRDPMPSVYGLGRLPRRVASRLRRTPESSSSPDAAFL